MSVVRIAARFVELKTRITEHRDWQNGAIASEDIHGTDVGRRDPAQT